MFKSASIFLSSLFIVLSLSAESLLYLGSTPLGWQVFRYNLETTESKQLTFTPGDKRGPRTVMDTGQVVFRDTQGRILTLDDEGKEIPYAPLDRCANFSLSPDGNMIYFTRLVTGNRQRQLAHSYNLKTGKTQLVHRPKQGSVNHANISPDGKYCITTYIWTAFAEPLLIIPVSVDGAPEFISEQHSVCSYPIWGYQSDRIYYAREDKSENLDLYVYELESQMHTCLLKTPNVGEIAPCPDSEDHRLFFERRFEGNYSLAVLDLVDGNVTLIPTPHQAKEPYYISR